jgi:transposase
MAEPCQSRTTACALLSGDHMAIGGSRPLPIAPRGVKDAVGRTDTIKARFDRGLRLRGVRRFGTLFVFRNRKATALKVLMYDGQGSWLCQKRLSQGRFPWWPTATEGATQRLAALQLSVLLSAGDPTRTGVAADWRPAGPLT